MAGFDYNFDPISAMTVLLAIRRAILAWRIDLQQKNNPKLLPESSYYQYF